MGKRELVALLNLSSWCLVTVELLFLAVPLGCLWFLSVVFPDHIYLLFCTVVFCQNLGHPKSIYGNSKIFDMVSFDSRGPSGIVLDLKYPLKPSTHLKSPMTSLYAFILQQKKSEIID